MNDTTLQAAPEWGAFRRWYYLIAGLLAALLLLLWLLGYGPGGSACKLAAASVAAAPVTAPLVQAAPPAVAAAPVAAAVLAPAPAVAAALPPAARVYFGVNKTALPADVDKTLAAVVAYLLANVSAKASISGFHDPSGNQAHNEELALNRARAVRAS